MNRRAFLAVGGGAVAGAGMSSRVLAQVASKPALLGGEPACSEVFPSWPPVSDTLGQAVAAVARSGRWYRDRLVETFEQRFAELNAAKHCIATSSGTTALFTSLGALGVGPGDEVIVPPFTFMATVTVVLLHHISAATSPTSIASRPSPPGTGSPSSPTPARPIWPSGAVVRQAVGRRPVAIVSS